MRTGTKPRPPPKARLNLSGLSRSESRRHSVLVAVKRVLLAAGVGADAFALGFVVLGFVEARQEQTSFRPKAPATYLSLLESETARPRGGTGPKSAQTTCRVAAA